MHRNGFTLLELMITLAIVAILATIAYPSYSAHLRHSRRQQAELALTDLASQMESYYALSGSYRNADFRSLNAQEEAADQHYQLNIKEAGEQTYELTAAPQNDQRQDACGTLSTNELGDHLAQGGMDTTCW